MAEKKKNWFGKHKILTVIGVIVLLAAIGGATGTDTNTSTNSSSNSENTQATESKPAEKKEPAVPAEYKSALAQADTYANDLHLSKKGLYDQLVSEYGGKFKPAAAKYAVDNVKADWKANALAQAKTYQNDLHLSPAGVRDQLVSEHGGQFTAAEADYAIKHLND